MSATALHVPASRANRETPPRKTKLMQGRWTCRRCGLSGTGGLAHESAGECVKALKAKLQFTQGAYNSKLRENQRLQDKLAKTERMTISGGLPKRIDELETAHAALADEYGEIKRRLEFVIGRQQTEATKS